MGRNVYPGDLAYFSGGNSPDGICHGICVYDNRNAPSNARSRDIRFEGVTVHSAPGMGFVVSQAGGGIVYDGVRIVPGPTPLGATAPRLTSTSWDAIMNGPCFGGAGPTLVNSEIRNAGDDSFSIQPQDYLVLKAVPVGLAASPDSTDATGGTATTATATNGTARVWNMVIASRSTDGILFTGDTLQTGLGMPAATLIDDAVPLDSIKDAMLDPAVVSKVLDAPAYSLWSVGGINARCLNVTVTINIPAPTIRQPLPSTPVPLERQQQQQQQQQQRESAAPQGLLSIGTSLYSQTHSCGGFQIRNNTIDSAGRILIKAGPGIIENNTVVSAHGTKPSCACSTQRSTRTAWRD